MLPSKWLKFAPQTGGERFFGIFRSENDELFYFFQLINQEFRSVSCAEHLPVRDPVGNQAVHHLSTCAYFAPTCFLSGWFLCVFEPQEQGLQLNCETALIRDLAREQKL